MEQTLQAFDRQPGKFRERGFIPGVLYGDSITAAKSIKFEAGPLHKLIARHGPNTKVRIELNQIQKNGFIREVQKDAISKLIIHVDVQMVAKHQEVKLTVPISFSNENILADRQLQLQVIKPTVSITGTMDLIPDIIEVDVAEMDTGNTITPDQLQVDSRLIVNDKDDTVYASVLIKPKEEPTETHAV